MPKKKPYVYKQEETSGGDEYLKLGELWSGAKRGQAYIWGSGGGLFMSPYTPFIPLDYVVQGTPRVSYSNQVYRTVRNIWNPTRKYSAKIEKEMETRWGGKTFTSLVFSSESSVGRQEWKSNATISINNYLEYDQATDLQFIGASDRAYDLSDLVDKFNTNGCSRIAMRNYGVGISPYSMYLRLNPTSDWREMDAYVLAVVLPENYMYVKYHILAHNTIPLDRIVILIDKELDGTEFPSRAARAVYKKLLPHIMQSKCQVWKVPHSFIKENCFINNYALKNVNIKERKKEYATILDEFYKEELCSMVENQGQRGIMEQIANYPQTYSYINDEVMVAAETWANENLTNTTQPLRWDLSVDSITRVSNNIMNSTSEMGNHLLSVDEQDEPIIDDMAF